MNKRERKLRVAYEKKYPDYGEYAGKGGDIGGGFPINLNTKWRGEDGPAVLITNNYGFRNDYDITLEKPDDVFRILIIGDSFIAGLRTDQKDTIGKVLENELSQKIKSKKIQVLVVGGVNAPAYGLGYLKNRGVHVNPDMAIYGLTLGNDILPGFYPDADTSDLKFEQYKNPLPEDAIINSYFGLSKLRLHHTFLKRRIYVRLRNSYRSGGVSIPDSKPLKVNMFDQLHTMGIHYSASKIPAVENTINEAFNSLKNMHDWCLSKNISFATVIFPQRFQVDRADRNFLSTHYGLNLKSFDMEEPNRSLMENCKKEGMNCIDLLKVFRKEKELLYFKGDDMHFNRNGQRVAAIELANYITSNYFSPE